MKARWLLLATVLLAGPASGQADPVREGTGDRLRELRAMELKPFDAGLWGKLSGWQSGPVTAESAAGHVVMIVTWAHWNPVASRAMPTIQRLYDAHGSEGLMVVGVHHARGYEGAADAASKLGLTFPIAQDADGAFRAAIKADQDPDIYFIDRAGQVRFADARTDAAEMIVTNLLKESVADAARAQQRIDDAKAEAEREFRTVRPVDADTSLVAIPEVPFVPPTDEAYQGLTWPVSVETTRNNSSSQEEISANRLSLRDEGWLGQRPTLAGRVVVVYHWHPDVRASHSPFQYEIDELARKRGRDVAVIGALSAFPAGENSNWSEKQKEEYRDPERLTKLMKEYFDARRVSHPFYADFNNSVWGNYGDQRGSGNTQFVPFAAIYSSDMRLRWYGYVGPLFRHSDQVAGRDAFLAALDRAIKIDPGVKARRDAEQAYLRSIGR